MIQIKKHAISPNQVITNIPGPSYSFDEVPEAKVNDIAWSADSAWLALAISDPADPVLLYSQSGGLFTKEPTLAELPAISAQSIDITTDGVYLAIGFLAANIEDRIRVYKRSGSTWTRITSPSATHFNEAGIHSVRWSRSGDRLAAAGFMPFDPDNLSVCIFDRAGDDSFSTSVTYQNDDGYGSGLPMGPTGTRYLSWSANDAYLSWGGNAGTDYYDYVWEQTVAEVGASSLTPLNAWAWGANFSDNNYFLFSPTDQTSFISFQFNTWDSTLSFEKYRHIKFGTIDESALSISVSQIDYGQATVEWNADGSGYFIYFKSVSEDLDKFYMHGIAGGTSKWPAQYPPSDVRCMRATSKYLACGLQKPPYLHVYDISGANFLPLTSLQRWLPSSSYLVGAQCAHGIAIWSAKTNNTNSEPSETNPDWTYVEAINQYRMFDDRMFSKSEHSANIEVRITASLAFDAIVFFGVEAQYLSYTIKSVPGGTTLHSNTMITVGREDYVITGIESPAGAEVSVTFFMTNGMSRVGELVIGESKTIGEAQLGSGLGIQNYSVRKTNEFGHHDVVKREKAKRLKVPIRIDNANIMTVYRHLERHMDDPSIWVIDSSRFAEPIIAYGFPREFEIQISYAHDSLCTLEIDGLT